MISLRLRPTFEVPIRVPRETMIERLGDLANQHDTPDLFRMHGEYGELHLPPSEHRVWSPHLSFYVTDHGQDHCVLGRFAPRVDVWTSVWIFYLLMAFTSFFGFTLAYSQWALGHSAWGLWIGVVPLFLIAALHVVAIVGQSWSEDQMHSLREQLEALVAKADHGP